MATDPKPADQEIRQEVERLREELTDHNHRYYVLDDPLISDAEYDQLFRRLANLEAEHPELHDPASPTQKVGAPPLTAFTQVRHTVPMLSLANVVSRAEMQEFHQRVQRTLETTQDIEYVAEPKIDGVAVELVYENGKLPWARHAGMGSRAKTSRPISGPYAPFPWRCGLNPRIRRRVGSKSAGKSFSPKRRSAN